MAWGELFERTSGTDATVEQVRDRLAARRDDV